MTAAALEAPPALAGIPLVDGHITVGSVCSGYDGLAEAVRAVLPPAKMAWVADVCKVDPDGTVGHHEPHRSPCTILAHHYPDAPNLGDITKIDWHTTPRVHVLCGGTPCQDLSHAGKQAGMSAGTRSNLWVAMREAIDIIRPALVVWENVGGAFSARADSELERDPRLLGQVRSDGGGGPVLRAAGRVFGDLASLGFDAEGVALLASDVGAPHGRLRVFVVAWPADSAGDPWWFLDDRDSAGDGEAPADPVGLRRGEGRDAAPGQETGGRAPAVAGRPGGVGAGAGQLLPTPRVSDMTGIGIHGRGGMDLRTTISLPPTPTSRDGKGRNQRDDDSCLPGVVEHRASDLTGDARLLPTPVTDPASGNGHARDLATELRLLPTPVAQWGEYAAAVHRWESAFRAAPQPVSLAPAWVKWRERRLHGPHRHLVGFRGSLARALAPEYRLNPKFSEWMMGLPDGWVTDVPGMGHNAALKALGNGVVPQQAIAALHVAFARIRAELAA